MSILEKTNLRELENLELLAKQVVEGFIIGLHKSPFHGFSVEFAEHRIYNPGESTKNIDWKVFARTDKLFTKKYEEETNLRAQVVIDTSSSMFYPQVNQDSDNEINKIRFSILAAASLMNLLRKQRDAFGLSLYDENLHLHSRTKSSMSHFRLMLTFLSDLLKERTQEKKTSTAESLHLIAERIHRRSLVMIFTDMFQTSGADDVSEIFDAIHHLKHQKHEVILFHVHDKMKELDFEFENRPYIFQDLETGKKVKLHPKQIKEKYQKKSHKFMQDIENRCLQHKIDLVHANIHEGFYPILQSYLVKRQKMNI